MYFLHQNKYGFFRHILFFVEIHCQNEAFVMTNKIVFGWFIEAFEIFHVYCDKTKSMRKITRLFYFEPSQFCVFTLFEMNMIITSFLKQTGKRSTKELVQQQQRKVKKIK